MKFIYLYIAGTSGSVHRRIDMLRMRCATRTLFLPRCGTETFLRSFVSYRILISHKRLCFRDIVITVFLSTRLRMY